jgi:hypothetical protein
LKKAKRIILRVLGVILALFVALWIFVWAYVTYNKKGLIEKVKAGLNKKILDKVDIKNISIDFFHNFPNISVKLSDVTIHDSLWEQHHHDFLKAGSVYARLRLFSIFSGSPDLGKLIIEDAQVYLYTDSSGYSNLIRTKQGSSSDNSQPTRIPDITLKNTRVIIDYASRHKLHDIELKELECNTSNTDSGRLLKVRINSMVHGLAFNDSIGTYLKEKPLAGNIELFASNKRISLRKAELNIDGQPFDISGEFQTGAESHFDLQIHTQKIPFKKAIGLLTERSQKSFVAYDIKKPIDIDASLNGPMSYRSIPLAKITFVLKDADMETAAGAFSHCSFKGTFTNEIDSGKPRLNDNSMITLNDFSCIWQKIPIDSRSIQITNLTSPFIKCDVHSAFNLADLNELTGSSSVQLSKGAGEMNMHYESSLVSNDSAGTKMDGSIQVKNAELSYIPRNITLKDLSAGIDFKDKDLFIRQLHTLAGTTTLNMNGAIKNFTGLIYNDPDKLTLTWNISTPSIDLVEFLGFLGKKNSARRKASMKTRVMSVSNKVDKMLQDGTAQLNVQASRVKYKSFIASNVVASMALLQDKIILNSARLEHAGGTISISGSMLDEGVSNNVALRSTITNVDIPVMLRSFDNFGQDGITWQNMKGRLNANVVMNSSLTEKGGIRDKSMQSTIDFSLKDAELNNFEPFKKIAVSVFKKRDFSHVRFAELKNKLEIKGSAINIAKMEIRSNVFTMFVDGVYDTKNGTDMNISLPLSNLKKTDDDEVLVNKGKVGLHIKLHATTGDDGKLKISWNPLGKITNLFKKKSSR